MDSLGGLILRLQGDGDYEAVKRFMAERGALTPTVHRATSPGSAASAFRWTSCSSRARACSAWGASACRAGSRRPNRSSSRRSRKRWPFVVLLLAVLGVAVGGLWMIRRRQHAAAPRGSPADRRRTSAPSSATAGDSLEVVVSWRIEARLGRRARGLDPRRGRPGRRPRIADHSSARATAVPTRCACPRPSAGQTAAGYSCVATVQAARLSRETCTPVAVRPSDGRAPNGANSARHPTRPSPRPRRDARPLQAQRRPSNAS